MTELRGLRVINGLAVDGAPIEVGIVDGAIGLTNTAAPVLDAGGLTVLPGLIDLQVNGALGIDLTLEPERLWEVAASLVRFGVTAFLPTIITSAPETRSAALAALAAAPPAGWVGATPLGLHFEGPMIAAGRKGAHPQHWVRPPSPEIIAAWSRDTGVAMVTLAPELPGALDLVTTLVDRGVVVAIGHTEASADHVREAVQRGARTCTHLGNAMPAMAGRDPGPVGVALGDERLTAGVIADGHHLDPATLAAYWRALGPDRFLAVTDCTAALGVDDGPVRLGDQHAVVRDGAVRLDDGTLAGSSADLAQCLAVLRAATGCSKAEAVGTCTRVPADLMGDTRRGHLAAGARGDLTLVDEDLQVVVTVVSGQVVHDRREVR